MNKKIKLNITKRAKTLSCIFVLCLVFFSTSHALANTKASTKKLSCKTLRSMARAYMAYGNYGKAQPLAETALKLAKERNVPNKELSMCLGDLSYIYTNLGQLDDAEKMCKLGLKLQEKVYDKHDPYVAYSLRNLSSIYLQQEKNDQAQITLGRALAIMNKYHTPDDRVLAPFYIDKAKILAAKNQVAQAETLFSKALKIIIDSYGADHLYSANVMSDVAEFYISNAKYDQAEPLTQKALVVQEKMYGSRHHLVAPSWLAMAKICRAKGQYTQAEKFIAKAQAAVEKTGNIIAIAKLAEHASETRAITTVAYVPTTNAVN